MSKLTHGTILKYLNNQPTVSLPLIRAKINGVDNLEEAKANVLLIENEMACSDIYDRQATLTKGLVAGAFAGGTDLLLKVAVDPMLDLSPQTMLTYAIYGMALGVLGTAAIDNVAKPIARMCRPITSLFFHDKQTHVGNLLLLAKTKVKELEQEKTHAETYLRKIA